MFKESCLIQHTIFLFWFFICYSQEKNYDLGNIRGNGYQRKIFAISIIVASLLYKDESLLQPHDSSDLINISFDPSYDCAFPEHKRLDSWLQWTRKKKHSNDNFLLPHDSYVPTFCHMPITSFYIVRQLSNSYTCL